jgi:FMN phosphatase YigB (HAD superfamily)
LFDLDGTLRHNRPSYFQSFFNFAVQAGAADSVENRLRATRWLHYYWAQSAELALAAGELNTYKPEPEIFLYAVEKMGKKPGETLYVGDNYYADVIGAQRAGLPVILLDPEGVFPDAECPVIKVINDLIEHLEK